MKLSYTVASISDGPVPVQVDYQGQKVEATIQGVTVELSGPSYTHTFRFTDPDDVKLALSWQVGDEIEFDLNTPLV